MSGVVVSLFDRTGVALRPWAEAGYECVAVDLVNDPTRVLHPRITYVQQDVLDYVMPSDVRFVMGWPPCTHLARSGARWWASKGPAALSEGLSLVAACIVQMERANAPWMIENPTGRLPRYWRKPDLHVEPWHFAGWSRRPSIDGYTKKTALWLGNGARAPAPNPIAGQRLDTKRISHAPSSSPRRSITPDGLARAIYVSNA